MITSEMDKCHLSQLLLIYVAKKLTYHKFSHIHTSIMQCRPLSFKDLNLDFDLLRISESSTSRASSAQASIRITCSVKWVSAGITQEPE